MIRKINFTKIQIVKSMKTTTKYIQYYIKTIRIR